MKVHQLYTITFGFQKTIVVNAVFFVSTAFQRCHIQGNGYNQSPFNKSKYDDHKQAMRQHDAIQQEFNNEVIIKSLWSFDFNFS